MPTQKRLPSLRRLFCLQGNRIDLSRENDSPDRFPILVIINKLEHFRVVVTRCDKRGDKFLTSRRLASIRIWLQTYELVT